MNELCECCNKQPATQWMEWGELLCIECAAQAIEYDEYSTTEAVL